MKIKLFAYALCLFIYGCTSQGFNNNYADAFKYTYKGVSLETAYMSTDLGVHHGTEIAYGQTLAFNFKNISGWTPTNGMVDIAVNIVVLDEAENEVKKWDGLFDQAFPEGIPIEDAGNFYANMDILRPMEIGKTYKALVLVKNRNESVEENLTVEHDFTVIEFNENAVPTQ